MPSDDFISKLGDSKKLTEKKREELYSELIEMSRWKKPKIFFGIWIVDNFIIDEINIRQANREAMRRAIVELSRKIEKPHLASPKMRGIKWEVLIDWRDNYDFEELKERPTYIVWGDWKIAEIWAASIIAKVFRDKLLVQYATLYPDLWIEKHKWYGTKKHREAIFRYGVSQIHRISFCRNIKKDLNLRRAKVNKRETKAWICPFCDTSPEQTQYILTEFKNKYRHLSYNKFPYGWVENRDKVIMAIPHRHVEHTTELTPEERQAFHDVEVFVKEYFWEKTYFMFIREHQGHKSVPHIHFHFARGKIHARDVASMIE